MFDPNRFQLFDAARTLTLTIGPVSRSDVLADFPAELIVSDEILAARLGVEPVPPSVITARIPELKALDEEAVRRLWMNPVSTPDGRTVFVSPVDALPDTGDTADWGLRSAGFLVSDPAVLGDWVEENYATDDIAAALSHFLSIDLMRSESAVRLTETATGNVLALWPVRNDNPLKALARATESYPEVRYDDEDFEFRLIEPEH